MSISVQEWHDPVSWNAFVATTPNVHFQQAWEWGDLTSDLGGRAVRLAALRNGVIAGASQIFINPLGPTGAAQVYVPRGPAVLEPSVEILGPLFEETRVIGTASNAAGIRVEPNVAETDRRWQQALDTLGLRATYPSNQPRSSWHLDIRPGEDELLAAMKQKTRYNIRLAAKKGVEIVEGGSDDLDEFYRLYRETAQRDDFFIHAQPFYRNMFDAYRQAGMFSLLFARHQGKAIALVTLIHMGKTCWYVQGASSNEHRNLMAPYLLQWEAIRRARAWGCELYDFRAVPDFLREDQDMYGVYRFKEGFGGYHFTAMHTRSAPYRPGLFGLWQLYFRGRFALTSWQRQRKGLPVRHMA